MRRTLCGIAFTSALALAGQGRADGIIAAEGFDYPAGTELNGLSGGVGFSGPWVGRISGRRVVTEGSLRFDNLVTTGNQLLLSGDGNADRNLSAPVGAPGTTAYFSFLLRPDAPNVPTISVGLGLLGTRAYIFIGKPSVGVQTEYVLEKYAGGGQVSSGVLATAGTTVLLVVRADFTASNDTFRLYVNPKPGGLEPIVPNAVLNQFDVGELRAVQANTSGGLGMPATMDEIRIGETFATVTPASVGPLVPPHLQDSRFEAGQFACDLDGQPDRKLLLQASSDLKHWVTLRACQLANTPLGFVDPESSLYPKRFYRLMAAEGVTLLEQPRCLGGQFNLNLVGELGRTAILEASTNLVNWAPLATNLLGETPCRFTDPGSTNLPARFYRVRLQE